MRRLAIATIALAAAMAAGGYGQEVPEGGTLLLGGITIAGEIERSWTAAASTQSTSAPTSQPATAPATAPTTQSTVDPERYLDRLLRAKPGTARPLQPVPPEEATAERPRRKRATPAVRSPLAPLKRDGDMVSERFGYLERTADGAAWQYAFESAEMGKVDPPMVLAPSTSLAAMEEAQERAGTRQRFRVTGLITSYRGQNYLLVEKAREWPKTTVADADEKPTTAPTTPPGDTVKPAIATQPANTSTQPTTEATTASTTQPLHPEETLARLLRPRPKMAAPLKVTSGANEIAKPQGIAPGLIELPLQREGEVVSQRIGRLKSVEGQASSFAFESDDKALADPPMMLIPNQRLAQMEDALKRAGIDLRFRVTGLITAYRGGNYLLIEKAELVTDHEGL